MITSKHYYNDIMTTDEACEYLNISMPHLLNLLRTQKIKGFKINKSRAWRITKPAIKEYLLSAHSNHYRFQRD